MGINEYVVNIFVDVNNYILKKQNVIEMVPLDWKKMKIMKGYAKMCGNMKNCYLQRTGREIT